MDPFYMFSENHRPIQSVPSVQALFPEPRDLELDFAGDSRPPAHACALRAVAPPEATGDAGDPDFHGAPSQGIRRSCSVGDSSLVHDQLIVGFVTRDWSARQSDWKNLSRSFSVRG